MSVTFQIPTVDDAAQTSTVTFARTSDRNQKGRIFCSVFLFE